VTRNSSALVAVLGALASSVLVPLAVAEEFHCRLGSDVRRVELLLTDDQDRLPCQVLYWRGSDRAAEPQILWRADFNLEFCFDKARDMIRDMQSAGWRCGVETQESHAIEPAAPPPPEPDHPALREAVARDLRRLEELVGTLGGTFDLAEAALGDLDGDTVADAAVLLNYESEGVVTGKFLLAYVFRSGRFEPAAKTALGPDHRNVSGLTIDERVIELQEGRMAVSETNHRTTYVLQSGELVVLDDMAADTAEGSPVATQPGS
jgi:hypothetical protein